MNRLIGLGCSFTYGHGLSDCFIPPKGAGLLPSKKSWVANLGNLLQIESINLSNPGASNLEILFRLLNFNLLKDDIVVILWTLAERDLLWKSKEGDFDQIQTGSGYNPRSKYWSAFHSDVDLAVRSWYIVHQAECYLESIGIRNLSFLIQRCSIMKENFPSYIKLKNFINADLTPYFECDIALDNSHPGPISHSNLAKFMFEFLK